VCQEVVPLQPPSGFSDGQELSEAECDREAVSGQENVPALPLFRHEELEQELSTLVKRFVTVSKTNGYNLQNRRHEDVPVYSCQKICSNLETNTYILFFYDQ
jgi:hypothetical protein